MLSLVSYDNSSDSELEETDEPEEANSKVIINDTPKPLNTPKAVSSTNSSADVNATSNELFTHLPQPKVQNDKVMEEEQDEFLNKKETPVEEKPKKRQPVKIGISSLDEFESDEEDSSEPAKKIPKQKGSGLFAMLPAPKCTPLSNTSFVPHVLKKKANPPPRKLMPQQVQSNKPKPQLAKESDDEDEIELPETFDEETWKKVCGKPKRAPKPAKPPPEEPQNIVVESAPDVQQPYSGLDNQAFKELVGSNKKAKENIEVIEINEDEIRPDREEWLKSLTDPNFDPQSNKKKNGINPTEKSKNHITALAQRALANDKELQLRWAESRHNRRMAAAKYGF